MSWSGSEERSMTDEIAFMPATQLLAFYRGKQLSPVEAIEETFRRLERYESAINGFVLYDLETAICQPVGSSKTSTRVPVLRAPNTGRSEICFTSVNSQPSAASSWL